MKRKGFSAIAILLVLALVLIGVGVWYHYDNQVSTPTSMIPSNTSTSDFMAIVQVMDYGYQTKILVNGQDIGWKGPGGGGVRLFNKENSYYTSKVTPEILQQNGILKQGQNTISVIYQKTDPSGTDTLSVQFQMKGYSDSLFALTATDASGKVDATVDVEPTQPSNFNPIVVQR